MDHDGRREARQAEGDRPRRDPEATWGRFERLMEARAVEASGADSGGRSAAVALIRSRMDPRLPSADRAGRDACGHLAAREAKRPRLRAFALGAAAGVALLTGAVAVAALSPGVEILQVARWPEAAPQGTEPSAGAQAAGMDREAVVSPGREPSRPEATEQRRRATALAALSRARDEAERHAAEAQRSPSDASALRGETADVRPADRRFLLDAFGDPDDHEAPGEPFVLNDEAFFFLAPNLVGLSSLFPTRETREVQRAAPAAAPAAGPAPPARESEITAVIAHAGGAREGIRLKRAIESAGFGNVVLRGSPNIGRRTQVRYYFDQDAAAAQRLAAALGAGAPVKQTRWIMRPEPGVIEAVVAGDRPRDR